ncbi:MAG: hypothetical protein JOZ22_21010 [Acidobacteriia bacterium]|nr:hypothetical protein [Terriglobia bacterium]
MPRDAVQDYLRSQGESANLIDWKYFDPIFNRDRQRGHVYISDGRIAGFIGLIPFHIVEGGKRIPSAWSCDWFRDSSAPGAMGIMLVRECLKSYERIYSLGGSETTRKILPKLARLTVDDAGVVLHKPLRLGGILRPLRNRSGWPFLDLLSFLDNVPLPRLPRNPRPTVAGLETGLVQSKIPLPLDGNGCRSHPDYDFDYLDWQIGRCPSIVAGTCSVPPNTNPKAAVLFWRPVTSSQFWRMVVLIRPGAYDAAALAIDKVVRHVATHRGFLISVLVSRLDSGLLRLLKHKGFLSENSRRPLYVLTHNADQTIEEPGHLSFLDTDWAYRFPALANESSARS